MPAYPPLPQHEYIRRVPSDPIVFDDLLQAAIIDPLALSAQQRASIEDSPNLPFTLDVIAQTVPQSGRVVIEPEFQAAADFHEGLARVYVWEKAVCAAGREYTKDDAPDYLFRLPGSYEISSCFPQDGHFGFIDKKGTIVVAARFYWLEDMSQGLAVARQDAERDTKYGYIDRTGSFPISPRFNQADSFAEGLAGVEVSSRIEGNKVVDIQRGYIDRSGRIVIPAVYEFVGSFSEGLARVAVRMGSQIGYVNREGKVVIAPRFSQVWDFSEGMAAACDDRGCTYINRTGVSAIKGVNALWPFSDGLAVVPPTGPRQVYIDSKGRTVARYN